MLLDRVGVQKVATYGANGHEGDTRMPTPGGIARREDFPRFMVENRLKGKMVEIGVDQGAFARLFLEGWDGEYIGVDPFRTDGGLAWDRTIDMAIAASVMARWPGRCRVLRWTTEEAAGYLRFKKPFALAYIDGSHERALVEKDIEILWPLVAPGGILAGHDYDPGFFDGVVGAVDEFERREGVHVFLTREARGCSPSWYAFRP